MQFYLDFVELVLRSSLITSVECLVWFIRLIVTPPFIDLKIQLEEMQTRMSMREKDIEDKLLRQMKTKIRTDESVSSSKICTVM